MLQKVASKPDFVLSLRKPDNPNYNSIIICVLQRVFAFTVVKSEELEFDSQYCHPFERAFGANDLGDILIHPKQSINLSIYSTFILFLSQYR